MTIYDNLRYRIFIHKHMYVVWIFILIFIDLYNYFYYPVDQEAKEETSGGPMDLRLKATGDMEFLSPLHSFMLVNMIIIVQTVA